MKTRESGMPEEEMWREFFDTEAILRLLNWNYDPTTPRGPSMEIRPRAEQCCDWAVAEGFQLLAPGIVSQPPYHYGMTLECP